MSTARIRRTRPAAPAPAPEARVRRTRPAPSPAPRTVQAKPAYRVDWNRPLRSLFQLYMVTSYLYYHRDFSLISDDEYDRLCGMLYDGWFTFLHPHKKYATRDGMQAVTGHHVKFPLIVQVAGEGAATAFSEATSRK